MVKDRKVKKNVYRLISKNNKIFVLLAFIQSMNNLFSGKQEN